jgi:beta-glucosidase
MRLVIPATAIVWLFAAVAPRASAQYQYPFQNPDLPAEERVSNIISTDDPRRKGRGPRDERQRASPGDSRQWPLGEVARPALGGPDGWGWPVPIPTTQFGQAIGMGETWDPALIRQAGGVEGYGKYRDSLNCAIFLRTFQA